MAHVLLAEAFEIQTEDGFLLKGEVHTLEDGRPKPILLLSHGFKGSKDWGFWPYLAGKFAERGFYTVRFDFARVAVKNSGASEPAFQEASTISRELADLEAIHTHVLKEALPLSKEGDAGRIALLGHSRAGSSNLVFAAEHPEVAAVVVWNGGVTPDAQAGQQPAAITRDIEAQGGRYHIAERLASLTSPALVVQGDADSERLLESNRALREAASEQTFISIPGADHTFGVTHPFTATTPYLEESFEATVGFLSKRL